MRALAWGESVWKDAVYGLRGLTRTPLLFLVAVLSLGLGIGVNITVFGLVNAIVLRDVTADRPERLARIDVGRANQVSYPNYRDLRDAGLFDGLAGFTHTEVMWGPGDRAERAFAQIVTSNTFDVLGVRPWLGRLFTAGAARTDVVVLSHGFWQRRLGADPAVVGRTLIVNGRPFTVLGVLPRDYVSLEEESATPQLYLPLDATLIPWLDRRDQICLELVGRLRDDATRVQTRVALDAVAKRLERDHPGENAGFGIVRGLRSTSSASRFMQPGNETTTLFLGVLGAVIGLVFLVACANVAGLLLARGVVRGREIAIRLAVGASRARLIRQLLVESLTLAILATAAGLVFSLWTAHLVSQIPLPTPVPYEFVVTANARLIAYASLLAALATLLCGLAPALRGTRGDLLSALRQEQPQFLHRRFTLRNLLVIGQVAMSAVLLVTAFLFLQSLLRITTIDPGFDAVHTLSARLTFPPDRLAAPHLRAVEAGAIERLRSTPDVIAASCAAAAPLSFSGARADVAPAQDAASSASLRRSIGTNSVCSRYFETMGIALLRGREFTDDDRAGAPLVAIINETMARQYFPGQDPLGQRLIEQVSDERVTVEIVGVVRDSKYAFLGEAPDAFLYRPFLQPPALRRQAVLLARTAGPPSAARAAVTQAIIDVDPSVTLELTPLQDAVSFVMLPSRVVSVLFAALGGLGLLLTCIGLHGTMAFAVSRRTTEIGIRMALGATRGGVLRLVLTDSLALIGAGLVLGIALAWLVMQPLARLLASGVSPADPVAFGLVCALLLGVGLAATLPSARRALRVDPNRTLRYE